MPIFPRRLLFIIAFLFSLAAFAAAVPPSPALLKSGFVPHRKTCFVSHAARLRRFGPQAAGLPPTLTAPTTFHVLVVLVDFLSTAGTTAQFTTSIPTLQAQMDKVRQFHLEDSYGLVAASFTLTGVFHTNRPKTDFTSGVACGDATICPGNVDLVNVLIDTPGAPVPSSFTFQNYDHIMILTPGMGQETTGIPEDFWSQYIPLVDDPGTPTICKDGQGNVNGFAVDNKCFDGVTYVPEMEYPGYDSLGVMCHEYSHQLGAVDLYDTSVPGGQTVVGTWSLMDYGVYVGSPLGSNPVHLDPWHKIFMGYLSPTVLAIGTTTATFPPVEASSTVYKVAAANSDVGASEYYLMEYRDASASGPSFDKGLPGTGLVVWHIDDTQGTPVYNDVNIGAHRPRVHLMRASANASSPNAGLPATGDAGDPYPGTSSVTSFAGVNWNGLSSQVTATSIAGAGGASMTALLQRPLVTAPVAVDPSRAATLSVNNVTLSIPAHAFPRTLNVSLGFLTSFSAPNSAVGTLSPTGAGVDITTDLGLQPQLPLTLTIGYTGGQASGLDPSQLVLARFDPGTGLWVPLVSTPDPAHNAVSAPLNHLSTYQVMQFAPAAALGAVKAFPNPVFSSRGQRMSFVSLPQGAKVTLFDLLGRKVRSLDANASGMASWDAANESGEAVASGVYFVLIESGSDKKTMKVMVER